MEDAVKEPLRTIWEYMLMHQPLRKADGILVLCSFDTIVAEWSAKLFLEGWAPFLMLSGGLGHITQKFWKEPEAELFARIAREKGVPADKILIEDKSANTGENVAFSRALLEEKGIAVKSLIVVQKPYMERRAYATFKKVWPEPDITMSSPDITFEDYFENYSNRDVSRDELINIIVGDIRRIKEYPQKGFQIPQHIPPDAWEAYEKLVKMGYDKYLVK